VKISIEQSSEILRLRSTRARCDSHDRIFAVVTVYNNEKDPLQMWVSVDPRFREKHSCGYLLGRGPGKLTMDEVIANLLEWQRLGRLMRRGMNCVLMWVEEATRGARHSFLYKTMAHDDENFFSTTT